MRPAKVLAAAMAATEKIVAQPVTILLDEFEDTDDTDLVDHTPAPTNPNSLSWEHLAGIATIQSNRVYGESDAIYVVDTSVSDCLIRETIELLSGSSPGMVIRVQDTNHRYLVYIQTGWLILVKIENESYSTVAQEHSDAIHDDGSEFILTVYLSKSSIAAAVSDGENDLATVEHVDTYLQTETKHGVSFGGYLGGIDKFQVVA